MATRSADKSNDVLESRYNDNPQSRMFSRLADSFRKKGNISKAIELCLNGIQNHPSYVTGRIILGRCYLEQENLPKAIEEFKMVCLLDRHNLIAIKMLADIFARQGMQQKAGDLYTILLKMDPFNKTIQKLRSQYKGSKNQDLFDILALNEPASSGPWNFTSVPLQEDAIFQDDTGEFQSSDNAMELLSSSQYQNQEQSNYAGPIEETINNINADSNLNGDDISEHLSSIFDEDSLGQDYQQQPIAQTEPEIVENLNYKAPEKVSGEDVTERIDQLFGQSPTNVQMTDDQSEELISDTVNTAPDQNQFHDISSVFTETIQFDRSFLDNATHEIPDNLIQDPMQDSSTNDQIDSGTIQFDQQNLITEGTDSDFAGYNSSTDPGSMNSSNQIGSDLIYDENADPDQNNGQNLIISESDQDISNTLTGGMQPELHSTSDTDSVQNGYLDLNIFDHSEIAAQSDDKQTSSNNDLVESLLSDDTPAMTSDNQGSPIDFNIVDNDLNSTAGSVQNITDDMFESQPVIDSSGSMEPDLSVEDDFLSFQNAIGVDEQSDGSQLNEQPLFDNNTLDIQNDSPLMENSAPENSADVSGDIFNTSPMDVYRKRLDDSEEILPQINESEDSLEVKTSVFNSNFQDDFEFLDNSLSDAEQPALMESDVESHEDQHTENPNDIFESNSEDSVLLNNITEVSNSEDSTFDIDKTISPVSNDTQGSEFLDFIETVQTADSPLGAFDLGDGQDMPAGDDLLSVDAQKFSVQDSFEPENAQNILEENQEQENHPSEIIDESIIADQSFSISMDHSQDNLFNTGTNPNVNIDEPEETLLNPDATVDHFSIPEELSVSTETGDNNFTGDSDLQPEFSLDPQIFDPQSNSTEQNNHDELTAGQFNNEISGEIESPLTQEETGDVQVEYDENVISEMDVLVTDSPLGIVSGDDVADKLDQIFSTTESHAEKEQPEPAFTNTNQNNSEGSIDYQSDELSELHDQQYTNSLPDQQEPENDTELPSFESYEEASSQFAPDNTETEIPLDHYQSDQVFSEPVPEPGNEPESQEVVVNNTQNYTSVPVITPEDLEERLEEFFPDDNLSEGNSDTTFTDEDVQTDDSDAGGFYTIYGDNAVNTAPVEDLHGIDEVEISHPIGTAASADDASSFYQEWNDACNSEEQLTTETIAINPPRNFQSPETGETFANTTMTDEDELNSKPYSIPDHVLTPTLADIYYQQGQYDLAIQIYSRLLDKDPENEGIRLRLQSIREAFEQNGNSNSKSSYQPQSVKPEPVERKRKTPGDNRPLAGVRIKKKPRKQNDK